MLAAGAGKLMITAGVAGAYFMILATAFIFEIAIEILFWAACAAYVDTTELKRTTPLICLAIALGGAFGGLLARALSWTVDAPDLLLVMVVFAGVAILQFAVPSDFDELQDSQSARRPRAAKHRLENGISCGWLSVTRCSSCSPSNALALTILYGIAEFLILSVYREHYPQEQELTRFLGIVFALLQACEFVLLASLSRTLLERTTPLVRNLVFPLTSLICFLGLAFSNKLGAAVIAHVNAEAASNAIFQPVHNANFLALPLRIQGRARTLAEGIFYPSGLAIAGAVLWWLDTTGAIAAAEFIAVGIHARLHPDQRRRRCPVPAHADRERRLGPDQARSHRHRGDAHTGRAGAARERASPSDASSVSRRRGISVLIRSRMISSRSRRIPIGQPGLRWRG